MPHLIGQIFGQSHLSILHLGVKMTPRVDDFAQFFFLMKIPMTQGLF